MSLRHKRALKTQYKRLLAEVCTALSKYDPAGIGQPQPLEEYGPEAQCILARMRKASSARDVESIVQEQFVRCFDMPIKDDQMLASIADEIWSVWTKRGDD